MVKVISPAHTQDLEEDGDDEPLVRSDHTAATDDEDDQPIVQPSSKKKKKLVKEKCDPAADHRIPAPVRREGPPIWQDPSATLEQDVSQNLRERPEEVSILDRKADGEALRNIVNKLSDERNSRDLHLKNYQMSTVQFKKRTTHWVIPGKVYDLYEHVVKTCPILQFSEAET